MKEETSRVGLTKEELKTIMNLLFSGKFGFSVKEGQRIITPLINKMGIMIDALGKSNEKEIKTTKNKV